LGKIYAVHPVKDDLTPALRFGGPILYACDRYVYSDEIVGEAIPHSVRNSLAAVAQDFDADNDFLLIAGDHLQLLILCAMLTSRHGTFRVLRFDRQAAGYVAVWI